MRWCPDGKHLNKIVHQGTLTPDHLVFQQESGSKISYPSAANIARWGELQHASKLARAFAEDWEKQSSDELRGPITDNGP